MSPRSRAAELRQLARGRRTRMLVLGLAEVLRAHQVPRHQWTKRIAGALRLDAQHVARLLRAQKKYFNQ